MHIQEFDITCEKLFFELSFNNHSFEVFNNRITNVYTVFLIKNKYTSQICFYDINQNRIKVCNVQKKSKTVFFTHYDNMSKIKIN